MRTTCQPVGLEHTEADGEQRERVDNVHAEAEDTLEHHHHQPQLHKTRGDRRMKQQVWRGTHASLSCSTHPWGKLKGSTDGNLPRSHDFLIVKENLWFWLRLPWNIFRLKLS